MAQKQLAGGRESYPCVDLIKFICALFVVMIHVNPFFSYYSALTPYLYFGLRHYMARIAVPFYFAAAGFFLFRKIDLERFELSAVREYVFKVLRLYAVWSILLLVDDSYHLWYMSSLAVAVVFLGLLFWRKISLNKVIALCGILYLIGLLGDSYYGLLMPLKEIPAVNGIVTAYEGAYVSTRNGLFMGAPFVLIGILFAQKRIQLKQKTAAVGFAISFAAMFLELFVIRSLGLPKDYNMNICLIPATVFLFGIATSVRLKDGGIYRKLRISGTIIYYSHLFVNRMVMGAFGVFRELTGINATNSLAVFVLTVAISAGLGFAIEKLSRRGKKTSFLRWLYA